MQTGVWVRWETSPKPCARLNHFQFTPTLLSSPVLTRCLMECVYVWCFSVPQAWSLCQGPEPGVQKLSPAGRHGSVGRLRHAAWSKSKRGKQCLGMKSASTTVVENKLYSLCTVSRLDLVNFPSTEWITSQRVPTSASESRDMISCVIRYFSQRLTDNMMTGNSFT